MASMRKAGKAGQKTHLERSQPENRQHLGELEKKKDYKIRARDYQRKNKKLKVLHAKTLDKNPDEFYFHMINSRVKDGIHRETCSKKPDENSILQKKLMESCDLRYVRYKRDMERKKIEKLQSELHLFDDCGKVRNKHTIFVDSKEEALNFKPSTHFKTPASLLYRTSNRQTFDTISRQSIIGTDSKADVLSIAQERKCLYSKLLKRMDRQRELTIVVNKLQLVKNLDSTKGEKAKRVLKGNSDRAAVYKWPWQRKR